MAIPFLIGAAVGAIGIIAADEAIKAYESDNKTNEGDLEIKLTAEEWGDLMAWNDEFMSRSIAG